MATKPSTLPEWASGSADITNPLLAKKQTGWVAGGEKPPHDYFNWWMNLVWQWCVYLDAFLTDAHTWAGAQTFNAADMNAQLNVHAGFAVDHYMTMAQNPAATTALSNTMNAKAIRKCWGNATPNGTSTLTLNNGLSVTSVTSVAVAASGNTSAGQIGSPVATNVCRVTFAQAMADTNYNIDVRVANLTGNNYYTAHVTAQTTSYFEFIARDVSGALWFNPAANTPGLRVMFGVDAQQ